MTKEEFLLRAVKDGSLTIDEALAKLESQKEDVCETSSIPGQKTRDDVINQLVHDALHGCWDDDPDNKGQKIFYEGFDWESIRQYLIEKDWEAVDLGQSGACQMVSIKDEPDLALHNAEYVAKDALKHLYEKLDQGFPEDDLQGYTMTGVFEATAWIEAGEVSLEVKFMPDDRHAGMEESEFRNAK